MKRYLVFGVDNHYPQGGMDDLIEQSDAELQELIDNISEVQKGNYTFLLYKGKHIANGSPSGQSIFIYDTHTQEEVFRKYLP